VLEIDQLVELDVLAHDLLEELKKKSSEEVADPAAVAVDVAIGRLSRLDSMQMEEVRKDAVRRRNQRIHELQEAVKRMDQGGYGQCASCREWIGYARLVEQPEARLCSGCA